MRRHHWIALAGAIGIFAISFTDAITQVVTGRDSAFATGEGAPRSRSLQTSSTAPVTPHSSWCWPVSEHASLRHG